LRRVLQNLLTNARDAMPSGGRVTIGVSCDEASVSIEVIDNGAGIPEEIRDRLFNPFVSQGKSEGTGLGLAIVKQIVDSHGGSVSFVTEECVGTTFTLTFPRAVKEQVDTPMHRTRSRYSGS
jgi:signal transduction histidine kinase